MNVYKRLLEMAVLRLSLIFRLFSYLISETIKYVNSQNFCMLFSKLKLKFEVLLSSTCRVGCDYVISPFVHLSVVLLHTCFFFLIC